MLFIASVHFQPLFAASSLVFIMLSVLPFLTSSSSNLHPSSNSTKRKEMLHSLQKSSARQSSIIQMQSTSMELTTFTTPTDLQLISPKTMPRMHSTMQTHALASNPISPKDILGKGQHCTRSRDTMIPSALTKKDWRSFPLIKV